MMSGRLLEIARTMNELTYLEMMEIADWFSDWTRTNENGEEMDLPSIDRDAMAANLSDWAANIIAESSTD